MYRCLLHSLFNIRLLSFLRINPSGWASYNENSGITFHSSSDNLILENTEVVDSKVTLVTLKQQLYTKTIVL